MPVQLFAALASFALLGIVIELIRSRKLRERYALLWLGTAGVILVFAIWREGLHQLSKGLGIAYPPNALFVLAMLFVLVLLLHFSTVISKLSDRSTTLAQRLALLEERLRELEGTPEPRLRDVSRDSDPVTELFR
ncbi:MAG TPA: DUF2304 domain-containing protein [Gaiellaceae bacterium]|nr:DUF2304 domain-containing protein [Gaiellaceae bacterium]